MRNACELALGLTTALGLITATACTDGGPTPETWELDEAPPQFEAHAGFEHQPEREQVVDPHSQPRLEVVAYAVDPDDVDYVCPYAVVAHQFPRISDDGGTLVQAEHLALMNADGEGGWMELTWLDADATRVERVYSREADERAIADELGCTDVIARVSARVDELNSQLGRRTWRPLERLDAFFSSPGFIHQMDPEFDYESQVLDQLGEHERPIEVFYRNEQFIARVRKVELLQTTSRPDWVQTEDEFCSREPFIRAIEFDPRTRVALVRFNRSTGGCLCDDRDYFGRIELSAELLAATERFSTTGLKLAAEAAMRDEISPC